MANRRLQNAKRDFEGIMETDMERDKRYSLTRSMGKRTKAEEG
jgi:hypothetical protein